jgi:putative PIN family toxin of toxin-antitoxin system
MYIKRMLRVNSNSISQFLTELTQYHVEPNPIGEIHFEIVRDPDDRVVLQSAIAGNAVVLITGDRHLLDVRDDTPQIKIQTPREFWNSIKTGK